jgi:putative OPT family oligopeptide transporter
MSAPTITPSASPVPETNGIEHKPYVPDAVKMPEFTWSAVIVGALLGIVFGASSLYLVLKVGLTVSASIPVAVLSITLFRAFSRILPIRRATILENNIVQTTGSAGESIAFGVGVTMPALMLLGFEMNIGRVMVVSVLGGLLGILMMIPLRRAFIVKQHGKLKYPEGTACADVLIVGEKGGSSAATVFIGFGIAFVYEFLRLGMKLFKDTVDYSLKKLSFKGATASIEINPALLGVGYIIGTRISCIMVAGGILSSFVLIPAIRLFGDKLVSPLYPATKLIADMSEEEIWHEYILYIGAGAVAAGGIISVLQALPLILGSIRAGIGDILASRKETVNGEPASQRTDRDLPLWVVGLGSLLLVGAIWSTTPLHSQFDWIPDLKMNPLGAGLIVLFGFLFVTVSSRLTGEIGSSSNPISGMTVATLLLTCLIFVAIGWTSPEDRLTALSIAAVVCIAASNGGTTSQDLKTGYLVGATPKWQQLAIVVGALSSAVVIGWILIQLNSAYTVYTTKNLPSLQRPLDVTKLPERSKAPEDDTLYHVWRAPEGNDEHVPQGEYLVDEDGRIRYLVDPGINGKRTQRDDGTEVTRFKAPKAVLMSLITDGILRHRLPWTLVLLGVSISLVLELCGIPSLAFAVGVYLPLSSSSPIFVGGLVRYISDKWGRRPEQGANSETDSDTSAGSLLATGYIAGGAIAGVVVAFLSFSDEIPRFLGTWQYRTVNTSQEATLSFAAIDVSRRELGYSQDRLPVEKKEDLDDLANEVTDLNANLRLRYVRVPAGMMLKLPKNEEYQVNESAYLGDIAKDKLGSAGKAQSLFGLNVEQLIRVEKGLSLKLPEDRTYKVPQESTLEQVAKAAVGSTEKAKKLYDLNKLNANIKPGLLLVPAGLELKMPRGDSFKVTKEAYLDDIAAQKLDDPSKAQDILDLNLEKLVRIPKDAVLVLPEEPYEVKEAGSLGEVAKKALGSADKAQRLYDLNEDELKPEVQLPGGTQLRLPQWTSPAVVAFGLLTLFLVLVGARLVFKPKSGIAQLESNGTVNDENNGSAMV